jgi:DNA-binding transcriptional regulator YiaG
VVCRDRPGLMPLGPYIMLLSSRQFEYAPADIKAIRKRLEKSQSEFALMIGVSVSTLRDWEQGRRRPEGGLLGHY